MSKMKNVFCFKDFDSYVQDNLDFHLLLNVEEYGSQRYLVILLSVVQYLFGLFNTIFHARDRT